MPEIQWFPGHMAKTLRHIRQHLKYVDIILDIRDARAPESTANPLLLENVASLPRIILLNKDDLSDPEITQQWMQYYREQNNTVSIRISAKTGRGIRAIPSLCRKNRNPDRSNRHPLRAMIMGIPNVGKSTIINYLCKRTKTRTGAKAGLTRDIQRITVSQDFELFDTPGMLWHKFDSPWTAVKIAALSAIKESILPEDEVNHNLLTYLTENYRDQIREQYKLKEIPKDISQLVGVIARSRGALHSGGKIDTKRICTLLLKDLREGKLGPLSLEKPKHPQYSENPNPGDFLEKPRVTRQSHSSTNQTNHEETGTE